MIWEIDSFDQWGVELGKQLANEIVGDLAGEEYSKQYAEYDNSTQGLIKYYRDLAK
jgi:glucose-6-phosphate isomerase